LLNGADDCVVDELSEDDETDGKPVNNDEKENQSSEQTINQQLGVKRKPRKRRKKEKQMTIQMFKKM
jgi:hypothetical protein